MRSPEEVFQDYQARKTGILTALTTEVDAFFQACDPNSDNLCLYGNSDSSWEVALPADEVPPEAPEPALGVNFARDGMKKSDWLSLVAVHSDSWLLSQAFFNGARLNREGRESLFFLINAEPTCYEIVSGKVVRDGNGKAKKRGAPGMAPGIGAGRPQPSNPALKAQRPAVRPPGPQRKPRQDDDEDDEDEEEEENGTAALDDQYADGEGDPCPNCGRVYRTGEFWIACDFCDVWYDGKCVQMTPGKAQRMGKWRCPACERKNV